MPLLENYRRTIEYQAPFPAVTCVYSKLRPTHEARRVTVSLMEEPDVSRSVDIKVRLVLYIIQTIRRTAQTLQRASESAPQLSLSYV